MPSKIILCSECSTETAQIEQTGNWKVTSCAPLPGEENKPAATQRCEIIWERVSSLGASTVKPAARAKPTTRPRKPRPGGQ